MSFACQIESTKNYLLCLVNVPHTRKAKNDTSKKIMRMAFKLGQRKECLN